MSLLFVFYVGGVFAILPAIRKSADWPIFLLSTVLWPLAVMVSFLPEPADHD